MATTVVRKCESIHTEIGCDLCVLDTLDSLDHDRSVPLVAELFEVRPAEGCVELGSGELCEGDGLGAVANAGLFAPLPEETLGLVPAAYRSPAGLWVGISARARVVVYNTEALAPEDLHRPQELVGFEPRGI